MDLDRNNHYDDDDGFASAPPPVVPSAVDADAAASAKRKASGTGPLAKKRAVAAAAAFDASTEAVLAAQFARREPSAADGGGGNGAGAVDGGEGATRVWTFMGHVFENTQLKRKLGGLHAKKAAGETRTTLYFLDFKVTEFPMRFLPGRVVITICSQGPVILTGSHESIARDGFCSYRAHFHATLRALNKARDVSPEKFEELGPFACAILEYCRRHAVDKCVTYSALWDVLLSTFKSYLLKRVEKVLAKVSGPEERTCARASQFNAIWSACDPTDLLHDNLSLLYKDKDAFTLVSEAEEAFFGLRLSVVSLVGSKEPLGYFSEEIASTTQTTLSQQLSRCVRVHWPGNRRSEPHFDNLDDVSVFVGVAPPSPLASSVSAAAAGADSRSEVCSFRCVLP
jgi:hypothetical protein